MSKKPLNKRELLVEAAEGLVYQQGFNATTLADVATHAGIPVGNLYYYFKTKEELGAAVIGYRKQYYSDLAAEWGKQADPKARIAAFIEYVESRRERLSRAGCPIGSLCQELHKGDGGALAEQAAALFTGQLAWLEAQFQALGCAEASADHALHLVSALQGAALLTNAYGDPALVQREASRLKEWIRTL